ncbi:MAG: hypothetical protein RSG07_04940 [Erysipelotrichaceae bacterium]
MKKIIIGLVGTLLLGFISFYIILPPLNVHVGIFWIWLIVSLIPLELAFIGKLLFANQQFIFNFNKENFKKIAIVFILPVAFIVYQVFSVIAYNPFISSSTYANRIKLNPIEFNEIKEVDFNKTAIVDRDSTLVLGDRVMGEMPELISQFNVAEDYSQVSYKDSVYRVTPLEYNGLIKYFTNKSDGIPAYITVNATSGESTLVKLKDLNLGGMKYVPSAMFGEDLHRKLRFDYPTEIFAEPSFEIDEKGHPWWICSTYTYKGIGMVKQVTGAVFLDPITGESTKYALGDVPAWADRVFPSDMIIEQIDQAGMYQEGFINSVFGQKNVFTSTKGYNYIELNGDIYLYTGITSANKDASNIGFVLVNLRTHEAKKIASSGADENSAMGSAEGKVQNLGYKSTFPLLVNVGGRPTYLVSLKDNAGLVKMYGMIDTEDYQKVVVVDKEQGLTVLKREYLKAYGSVAGSDAEILEKDITVALNSTVTFEGETLYYLEDQDGLKYKIKYTTANEEVLPFLKQGLKLHVKYYKGNINEIESLSFIK